MACAVFDLGTALTLDVVDALGCHCGGYILPGLSLMQDVLQLKTQQVRFDAGQVNDLAYGRNTASAVLQGTVSAVVAWINAEIIRFNRQYPNGRVYLTGGSAQAIMPYIVGEIIYDEDLILNALMRIASN
jgi:type III pantothenate kinase